MGLRQVCDFKPALAVVGVNKSVPGPIELEMNPYPRNMKHRDGEVAVECVWFSL
jgi:hypothetical protein